MSSPKDISTVMRVSDESYDYKILLVPPSQMMLLPKGRLLTASEVARLGVIQSVGWEHFHSLPHEKHALMLRRSKKSQESPLKSSRTNC
jgi:hypothetical protein